MGPDATHIAATVTFRTSPRMLEWATPFVYAITLFLLLLTLVIGTGAGTAAGSKSWIAIGGHRFGQPAELAKLQRAAGVTDTALVRWLEDEIPSDAIGWTHGPPIRLAAENKDVQPIKREKNGRVLSPLDRGEFWP